MVVRRSGRCHPALGQARDPSAATPAPRKNAKTSRRNIAAGRPRATRRCWPIPRSRRSSTRRRTTCIWRRPARPLPPASTSFSTSRSPTPSRTAAPSPRPAARPAWCWRSAISGGARATSAGSGSRSTPAVFGKLVNAEANISRDRLGKIDLASWRYQAAGMPGGVMLQIGIHYVDVLEYLIGPIQAVRGQSGATGAARRQSGCREPDAGARQRRALDAERELRLGVRILSDEHLRQGHDGVLRSAQRAAAAQARRKPRPSAVPCAKNDTLVEELEEFAAAARGQGQHEVGGEDATRSLAVVRAGILSAREGRRGRGRRDIGQ